MKNFILILIFLKIILSQIIFPFTIKTNENIKDPEEYIKIYQHNNITLDLNLGTPYQKLPIYLKLKQYPFSISSSNTNLPIETFKEKESSTLEILSKEKLYEEEDFKMGKKVQDIFLINNNKLKLHFILSSSQGYLLQDTGIIGLTFKTKNKELLDYTFLEQLKENKLIEKQMFFLEYNNDFEGNFIIGKFPHEINKKKYNKNNYIEILPEIKNKNIQIRLNDINYGKYEIESVIDCVLSYEDSLLRGTRKYKEIVLNKFFNEYIENNHCFNTTIGLLGAYIYYCDDTINITKFQPLIFTLYESNYTFELDYNDLFIKKGKYYYFLCYFYQTISNNYLLGKPFFKKYTFLFNKDNYSIGFYLKENSNNYFKIFPWVILIFSIGIIIFLSYYIYKNIKIKRKKQAHELIEELWDSNK